MVVLIHYPLPGALGDAVRALARFAVPMFFALTGRFLFPAGVPESGAEIRALLIRRIGPLLKTTLIVWGVYTLYSLIMHLTGRVYIDPYYGVMNGPGDIFSFWLKDKFNPHELIWFFLFNSSRVIYDASYTFDHLWYLFAVLYVLFACYVFAPFLKRFYGVAGLVLLLALLTGVLLQTVYPIRPFGLNINERYYLRNWLFTGIPFTFLGVFFGERAAEVKFARNTLPVRLSWLMTLAGIALTIAEWMIAGTKEVYFGSLLIVISLLFLSEADIYAKLSGLVAGFGKYCSSQVYYWHVLVIGAGRALIT